MADSYPAGMALHKKLQRLAVEAGECHLTLGEGLRRLASSANGYEFPLLLLSFAGVLPMPTFGLKILAGVIVTLLGLQMLGSKNSVWLPHWFIRIWLRPEWILRAACLGERLFLKLEVFVKPRMNWMRYRLGSSFLGLAVVCLGLVFMLSIIPGAKILAGFILLALSIGLIKSDGLLTLAAALAAVLLLVLHAEAVYFLIIWLTG